MDILCVQFPTSVSPSFIILIVKYPCNLSLYKTLPKILKFANSK